MYVGLEHWGTFERRKFKVNVGFRQRERFLWSLSDDVIVNFEDRINFLKVILGWRNKRAKITCGVVTQYHQP